MRIVNSRSQAEDRHHVEKVKHVRNPVKINVSNSRQLYFGALKCQIILQTKT